MIDQLAIKDLVTEFREGILGGQSSYLKCILVCDPLESYLRYEGIETHVVSGFVWDGQGRSCEHFWLETEDGTVIDPTADQFVGLNLPPVYIGSLPPTYIADIDPADAGDDL